MNVEQLHTRILELLAEQERTARDLNELRQVAAGFQSEITGFQSEITRLQSDYQALVVSSQTLLTDRDRLRQRVEELEAINAKLTHQLWGRRSERHLDKGQPRLWEEEPLPTTAEEQGVIMAQEQADQAADEELLRQLKARREARRQKPRDESLPEHLERRERIIDLTDEEKVGLQRIGEAVTERLVLQKPKAFVDRIVRPKYVVTGDRNAGVKAAPPPLAIVEGTKYDASVYAAVVAHKYAFHLPTYRQQDWLARCGVTLSRSTMNEMINAVSEVLIPLFNQIVSRVKQEPIVLGDDTQVRLLTRDALDEVDLELLGRRRAKKLQNAKADESVDDDPSKSVMSHAWLYAGLDDGAPYNFFHWSLTREHATVDSHLAGFQGTLVGDAFGGNARIASRSADRIRFAACNVHARREFVAAEKEQPLLVSQALSLYRQLYDVEERGKSLSVAERHALRQRVAEPIWQRLHKWLDSISAEDRLPKSKLGKAIVYLRNHWDALRLYLSDGRLPIDNQASERTIRPLTIGRKNWMFIGHPRAAESRLRVYSIVSSARRHHLMVDEYLEGVLTSLAHAQQHCPMELLVGSERLLGLLPDRWAATHPDHVLKARVEEKADRSEVVRARRARQRVLERAKARR